MTKTNHTTERETVMIARGQAGEDPNLFVSVGGINYLLPKGESSTVPREVAYEIGRAERARARADERARALMGG